MNQNHLEECEYIIDQAPTEDVQPVIHAKWTGRIKEHDWVAICSNCKTEIEGTTGIIAMNYCLHCGAKMDLGQRKPR